MSGTELSVGETGMDVAHCLSELAVTVILAAPRGINIYAVTLTDFQPPIYSHLLGPTFPLGLHLPSPGFLPLFVL